MNKERIFKEEVYVHYDYFLRVAKNMTQNLFDAEDLLQDSFARAYRFLDSFEPGTNSKAWVYRIMKNLFINFNRKKQAHPNYSLDSMQNEPFIREDQNTLRYFEVMKLIEKIKDEYRQVIILYHLEEHSLAEISKALNWPLGTVKSRLHRARKEFRKVISETNI